MSKNTGSFDFGGQESRDPAVGETPPGEAAEDRDVSPVAYKDTSNKFNGSGGSRKTFSSASMAKEGANR